MGAVAQWSSLKERAAGKWQLPLFFLGLVMLGGSLYVARPTPKRIPLSQAVEQLDVLLSGGLSDTALQLGEVLLLRKDYQGAQCALIHLRCARAAFAQAARKNSESASVGRTVAEHYRAAVEGGETLTAADLEHMGRALEWKGQFSSAIEYYNRALQAGTPEALELQRHMIALKRDRLGASPQELQELVGGVLRDVGDDRLDLRLWAIEEQLGLLEEQGRLAEAATLFTENEDHFRDSDLKRRFEFLGVWWLYKTGRYDEAEAGLRTIRNQVERTDDVNAMTGWLLGRVVMSDGGPQRPLEALSFFEDVLRNHPRGRYATASRVGMAEALSLLERHEEAIAAYDLALEELRTIEADRLVNRAALAASLGVMAETQRQSGHLEPAVKYARLAVGLVDREKIEHATLVLQQFAQTAALWAEERRNEASRLREEREASAADAALAEARSLFAEAAATHLELAKMNTLNERRASESSWQAAELYAKAGDTPRAVQLHQEFVRERPDDPLVPRAWLRMGQLRHGARQFRAAIVAYQECYRRFPRNLDGARALVPLARCYLGLGADSLELAEKTLRVVLEQSEVFTPEAPEFADALFLLGDVLSRRGEFERAVATLEEALDRYPDDPRVRRARFLLADSYRQSALALRREISKAQFEGEIEQIRNESAQRLATARDLYRQVVAEYETPDPANLDPGERMYLRHAYLYEADCYFETQNFHAALKLYEEAAGNYRGLPSGLAAYIQIINCHVFLGQPEEARAALARALVLVNAMPQEAFEQSASPETRNSWKTYFEWLGESGLF